jgi:hypothetical protein
MLKTVSTQLALASDTLSEILAKGNTTGGTDLAVSAGDDITFADNSKAIFGAGSDISIYSDGSTGQVTGSVNVTGAVTTGGLTVNTPSSAEIIGVAGDSLTLTARSGDATAANNAGGGFRNIGSATATSRSAQMWLDADGANLGGGDYFYMEKKGNSGDLILSQYSNADMIFRTNGDVEAARFTSTGNLAFPSGQGIDFSATAGTGTSELLDDYEEGTWTPSLGGTTTYLAQGGTYTKIGRIVNFHCVLYINAIGTGSVTNIGGLPFSAATSTGQGTVTILGDCNTSITYLVGYVNNSQITLKGTTTASAAIADISVFKALTYIEIFGSYAA